MPSSSRFAFHLKSSRVAALDPGRRVILMGSISNPLVKARCAKHHIDVTAQSPGPEGYVLRVDADTVLIAGADGPQARIVRKSSNAGSQFAFRHGGNGDSVHRDPGQPAPNVREHQS